MGAKEHIAVDTRGLTLATAESLTGGLLGHLITSIPGASAYYRGGIVAYATEAKSKVLGVNPVTLSEYGPVSPEVATAMAEAVRELFGTDIGLSTTGVAGPAQQDGKAVGTIFVGIASPQGTRSLALHGQKHEDLPHQESDVAAQRNAIREWAAMEALQALEQHLLTSQP